MSAPTQRRLKDGRLPGVLARRLLDAMVARPGQLVTPATLRPILWPGGAEVRWRQHTSQAARRVNRLLGAEVLVRVGTARRLDGFRLQPAKLPWGHLTRRQATVRRFVPWDVNEDAILMENVPALPLADLAARVNAAGGRNRTTAAVEARIYRLGLSKERADAYTAVQLAAIFGTYSQRVLRWIEEGRLVAKRRPQTRQATYRSHPGWWMIRRADAELFIRAYPWEVDWRAMRQDHPLTVLARTVQRRDPYLTLDEAVRKSPLSRTTFQRRLAKGLIPGAVMTTPHAHDSARGTWRIPLSALALIPTDLRRRSATS